VAYATPINKSMKWIFDTTSFIPRLQCGEWSTTLVILYIIANWLIALSYYAIPIILYVFWAKRRLVIEKHWIILLFIGFILLCGTTHLLEGLTFWWPAYRFLTLMDLATAIMSLTTAGFLIPVIRFKLHYKTPKEYEALQKILEKKSKEEQEMVLKIREINHELANRIQYLQNMLSLQGWISDKQLKLHELKGIVESLRSEYRPKVERILNGTRT
jgi:hypothetical protein